MLWQALIASLCVIGVALAEQTPVFLWGANSDVKPSLRTVPQAEFADQLSTLLKDHMVVAFEENGLTNKDFMCSNAETESCYAQLQGVSPKIYYTSVENPVEALRSVAAQREHNSIDAHGQLSSPIKCSVGSALFITFDDAASDSRAATLESHDAAIAAISKQLKCKVAYLYTATPASSSASKGLQKRQRRDIGDTGATTAGTYWRSGNQFFVYYKSIKFTPPAVPPATTSTPQTIDVIGMQITNSTTPNSQFSVKLSTADAAKSITFDVVYTNDGYYNIQNLMYNNLAFLSTSVNAPTSFSYFCGDLLVGAKDSSANTLTFASLQLQAPFNGNTKNDFAFGDAWHCTGFVTPGILMGLFVTVLLLVIIFVGICWMMDINTMDRFDDPKGKTITINASAD